MHSDRKKLDFYYPVAVVRAQKGSVSSRPNRISLRPGVNDGIRLVFWHTAVGGSNKQEL